MSNDDLEFERLAQGVERLRADRAGDDELLALLAWQGGGEEPLHDAHVLLYYGFDLTACGMEGHDIAPCPFCPPCCVKPGLMHDDANGWPVKYVMCYACGSRGPNASQQSQALKNWNRRAGGGYGAH